MAILVLLKYNGEGWDRIAEKKVSPTSLCVHSFVREKQGENINVATSIYGGRMWLMNHPDRRMDAENVHVCQQNNKKRVMG